MEYFALQYRLHGADRLLIWISNDADSVAVNAQGSVESFPDMAALRKYADSKGWAIEDEDPVLHDLDALANWISSPDTPVDCEEALIVWNLFTDIASSVKGDKKAKFEKLDAGAGPIYQKLFWGNNLPSMTPEGKQFVPTWTADETKALVALLAAGLEMFSASVATVPHASGIN